MPKPQAAEYDTDIDEKNTATATRFPPSIDSKNGPLSNFARHNHAINDKKGPRKFANADMANPREVNKLRVAAEFL